MSLEIILIVFAILAAVTAVYFVKFKDKSKPGATDALFDMFKPERAKKRKEDEQKRFAWMKTVDNMNLPELNDVRSKLIKKDSLLMKTGRDLKIIEAQEELHSMRRIVEEKIRTLNSK